MTKETKYKLVKGLVQFSKYTMVFLGGVATAALINEYGDAVETKDLLKKKQEQNRDKVGSKISGSITDTGKPIILAHAPKYTPDNIVEDETDEYIKTTDLGTGFSVIRMKKAVSN